MSNLISSGVSEAWSVESGVLNKPVHPFREKGSERLFYANGGTADGYISLMKSYYAAFRSNGVSVAGMETPVSCPSRSSEDDVVAKVSAWGSTTSLGLDPPGMPIAQYEASWRAKKSVVDAYGPGFCYLYVLRTECIDRVAVECGVDCNFFDLLKYCDEFESDAYLALLRIEVDGEYAHIDPAMKRGTRFLTLCRALEPGMAPDRFYHRMAMYKLSNAGSLLRSDLKVGIAGVSPNVSAAVRPVRFYDDPCLKLISPGVPVDRGRQAILQFAPEEVCKGYVGLVSAQPVVGRIDAVIPSGFGEGYVYLPTGAGVFDSSGWVMGPLAVRVGPGTVCALRLESGVDVLWLSVIMDVTPLYVRKRVPPDIQEDARVAEAFRVYHDRFVRGVGFPRSGCSPGSPVEGIVGLGETGESFPGPGLGQADVGCVVDGVGDERYVGFALRNRFGRIESSYSRSSRR